ncbi:hypothetical protein M378DRAFT_879822 [Amanita muscaria Koide BX008]|uniref:DUF6593 domain-containing protein n=1 Tax=Amanita muscaria (strain Koide BX008) TaxID=946122 RepID=A0A0C2XHL4_AMAMK|nr:hypothetical protein M378DRAFT_879822 [Amanita muscaria Koide BX008]
MNCSYVNNNDQVLYVVETPNTGRFKTVSTVKRTTSSKNGPDSSNDNFTDIAELAYNHSSSRSFIRLGGGQEYETSRFISKVGRKNDLVFTGPDSVEYKWRLGNKTLQLVRRNADKTPIALFHPESIESPSRKPPASLEIFSEGEHMVDLIIVTYVFAQKEYDSRGVSPAGTVNVLNAMLGICM